MAIIIEELRVNDIVLSPKDDGTMKRCIVRALHGNQVSVDYLNMQNGKMEQEEISSKNLEPVSLMESTLYALGFRKSANIYYGSPTNTCYVLKRKMRDDIVVIKTNQWHLLIPSGNGLCFVKQELYMHTLQNYMSSNEDVADEVSHEMFVNLTSPYCILPFEPKEE